jgi:hypothetical protein
MTIQSSSKRAFESNIIEIVPKSIHSLPRLWSMSFINTVISYHDGIRIAQWLIGKRSMEGLRMVNCTIDHRATSTILDALKTQQWLFFPWCVTLHWKYKVLGMDKDLTLTALYIDHRCSCSRLRFLHHCCCTRIVYYIQINPCCKGTLRDRNGPGH